MFHFQRFSQCLFNTDLIKSAYNIGSHKESIKCLFNVSLRWNVRKVLLGRTSSWSSDLIQRVTHMQVWLCVSWVDLYCTRCVCVCFVWWVMHAYSCTVSAESETDKEVCILQCAAAGQPGGQKHIFCLSLYALPGTQLKTPKKTVQGLCVM